MFTHETFIIVMDSLELKLLREFESKRDETIRDDLKSIRAVRAMFEAECEATQKLYPPPIVCNHQ